MLYNQATLQKKKKKEINKVYPPKIPINRYIEDELRAYYLDDFMTYLYVRQVRPTLIARDLFPRPVGRRNGELYVHIDSIFTEQRHRRSLRLLGKPFTWETYYNSILQEELKLDKLHILYGAKEFGIQIHGISTTILKYKSAMLDFLNRHNLTSLFSHFDFPLQMWRSESRFLRNKLKYATNNSNTVCYTIYDQEQYPMVKWQNFKSFF